MLWELTEADLAALDEYEGVASGVYHRATKRVRRLAQADSVDALLYRAADEAEGLPHRGYMEVVLAAARLHGLPEP